MNHVLGKLGVTHDLDWWAHGRPSMVFIERIFHYYGSGVMRWNVYCTVRLFSQGIDLFALKFYLDRVVPHQNEN